MGFYRIPEPVSIGDCIAKAHAQASIIGDASRLIHGFSPLDDAAPGSLCFCRAGREAAARLIAASPAAAVIVGPDVSIDDPSTLSQRTLVRTQDPMRVFIACINALLPETPRLGVDPGAQIAPDAKVAQDVLIERGAVIDDGCSVGAGSRIHAGARIYPRSRIGAGVQIQSNAVIGATGLAFGQEPDGRYVAFPHLGGVIIGDHVAIGANSVIVSGILTDTRIGDGTKIGNHVNVGHNVSIGRHCFISSGVTLCGSVAIEDRCWIAAGAVLANHVRIGAGSKVYLGAVVTSDVLPGAAVAGMPARVVPA